MPDSHYFSHETPLLDARELSASSTLSQSIGNLALQFLTAPAVFAKGSFDTGSLLLLETFFQNQKNTRYTRIGDLGSGYGAIGVALAHAHPETQIFSSDINPRAVQLCRENYRRNGCTNGFAWCGDGFDALRDQSLDAIFFNPPVRAGNAVIAKLFDDCERVLTEGGALWVVLRTAQGAKTWAKRLETQFGRCQTLEISRGFRILLTHNS